MLLGLLKHYQLGNFDKLKSKKDKYQQHDWSRHPADDHAILYAANDSRYLILLWGLLSKDFAKESKDKVFGFMAECATICAGKLGEDDRVIVEQNSRTRLEMTINKYSVGVRWDANIQSL